MADPVAPLKKHNLDLPEDAPGEAAPVAPPLPGDTRYNNQSEADNDVS